MLQTLHFTQTVVARLGFDQLIGFEVLTFFIQSRAGHTRTLEKRDAQTLDC